MIPDNSCNIRGECCSTPSPTASPTRNPTQRPTTAAPTTRQPTPNPTTPRPTSNPTPRPTRIPTPEPTTSPTLSPYSAVKQRLGLAGRPTSGDREDALNCVASDYDADWSSDELTQRYVLALFLYHATSALFWLSCPAGFANDWGCSPNPSLGAQITCNGNNRVTALNFEGTLLGGTMPPELGDLPFSWKCSMFPITAVIQGRCLNH